MIPGSEDIHLSDHDVLWLKTAYQKIKQNKKVTYRIIRTELRKQLPREYHPRGIDRRVSDYGGIQLTIIGVNIIDPQTDIINKANRVLQAVQRKITADPDFNRIETSDIAELSSMAVEEVGFVLTLVRQYGYFWSTASGSNDYYGYSSIGIEDSDDKIFDEYTHFENIEIQIGEFLRKQKERREDESLSGSESGLGASKSTTETAVQIRPVFNSVITQKNKNLCFVLMPFTKSWSDIVYNKIRTVVETLGFQCTRADNLTGRIVMEDIWIQINQAAFIIADVTDRNPNVMYELGIAHTVGTPTILITQDIDGIPFDFKHLRHVPYQDSLNGWKDAEALIINSIKSLVEK